MRLRHKILIIFILIFCFFLLNENKVSANPASEHICLDFEQEYIDFIHTLPESQNFDTVAFVRDDAEYCFVLFFPKDGNFNLYLECRNWDGHSYLKFVGDSFNVYFYKFKFSNPSATISEPTFLTFNSAYVDGQNYNGGHANKIYTTRNIYGDSSCTTLFKEVSTNDFKLTSINFTENTEIDSKTLETNMFNIDNVSKYRLYVSYNNADNFVQVGNISTFTNVQENKIYFYFTYIPDKNGLYYFRLFDSFSAEWSNTLTFDFIGVDFDSHLDNTIETPDFYIKKENNSFILQTQWLDISKRDYFSLYYSRRNNFFINCFGDNLSTLTYTDTTNNTTYFRYQFVISYEGTYYFKFLNTQNIDNVLSSEVVQVNLSFNSDYEDTLLSVPGYDLVPSLDYTLSFEEYDKVIIYSQWFDNSMFNCYKLYVYNNISEFIDTYSETEFDGNFFRFKYTATENRVYHFRIYKKIGDTSFYSQTVSINITSIGKQTYIDYIKDKMFRLYENSFGFLIYPFTLFFDICNRFLNIEFSEPIINIPDFYIPYFENNVPLIKATSFNFNTYIDNNSTFKLIHNLILICSDAIIVFGLVSLLRKKWNEVFR